MYFMTTFILLKYFFFFTKLQYFNLRTVFAHAAYLWLWESRELLSIIWKDKWGGTSDANIMLHPAQLFDTWSW